MHRFMTKIDFFPKLIVIIIILAISSDFVAKPEVTSELLTPAVVVRLFIYFLERFCS